MTTMTPLAANGQTVALSVLATFKPATGPHPNAPERKRNGGGAQQHEPDTLTYLAHAFPKII
jgi:hypothetical protein